MVDAKLHQQEKAFITKEADAYFERNAAATLAPAPPNHHVLSAMSRIALPERGLIIDVGGGTGYLAAGFLEAHPTWSAKVVEPSGRAIDAGKKAFPNIEFHQGSITQHEDFVIAPADLVLVSVVFSWVERALLSRAVSNVDVMCKNSGHLVISDFDTPFPRANPYKHHRGLFTYKQDYAGIFRTLGIYTLLFQESKAMSAHSKSDDADPYDTYFVTSILRKDTQGRYYRAPAT